VNNALANQSLEALCVVFANCPAIQRVNLQNNLLGQGFGQLQAIDMFLNSLFSELDAPLHLDLSCNKFTDEGVYAFVKYVMANEECRLTFFSLEENPLLTNFGLRTLLKAYSLSPHRTALNFRLGPLPFTENTLKHAFNSSSSQYDYSPGRKAPGKQGGPAVASSEKFELTLTRRPNYTGVGLRALPMYKPERDKLQGTLSKLDQAV
jgi:hypothetical protein